VYHVKWHSESSLEDSEENRVLAKPRIAFAGQEGICEEPELTIVNEDFE